MNNLNKIFSLLISVFITSSACAGSVSSGKELVDKNNCISCHGPDLKNPIAPAYPKIAGQYEDYIYFALKAYQVENNPHVGRANAIMGSQAKQFSHSQLRDIAAYVSSLPGDFVVKK